MLPRSCLEDMAWEHSGATEIGRQQVAAGGWGGAARRFVSIRNSYSAKTVPRVTDSDKRSPAAEKSRSVTSIGQKRPHVLQINTFPSAHPQQSQSVTSRPAFDPYPLQIEILFEICRGTISTRHRSHCDRGATLLRQRCDITATEVRNRSTTLPYRVELFWVVMG